jgi:hypothetical protein
MDFFTWTCIKWPSVLDYVVFLIIGVRSKIRITLLFIIPLLLLSICRLMEALHVYSIQVKVVWHPWY